MLLLLGSLAGSAETEVARPSVGEHGGAQGKEQVVPADGRPGVGESVKREENERVGDEGAGGVAAVRVVFRATGGGPYPRAQSESAQAPNGFGDVAGEGGSRGGEGALIGRQQEQSARQSQHGEGAFQLSVFVLRPGAEKGGHVGDGGR